MRRIGSWPLLAAVLAVAGCAGAPAYSEPETAEMTRHTLIHDGIEREYFIYRPAAGGSRGPLPALFFLHGYGGTATGTEAETTNGLNRYAERYGYLVVYPQSTWFVADPATGDPWVVSSWNHPGVRSDADPEGPLCTREAERYPCPPECGNCGRCDWASCHDDLGFIGRLIGEVSTRFLIDRARTFISGFSNGSMMAQRVACQMPGRFAAVALVGGRLEPGFQCAPAVALPLLQVDGGRDPVVPADGRVSNSGYFYAAAGAVASRWAAANGCRDVPRPWVNSMTSRHGLECVARCPGSGREIVSCRWADGEHFWPGYPPEHGSNGYCVTALQQPSIPRQPLCVPPNTAVETWGSRLVFDFFERHRR